MAGQPCESTWSPRTTHVKVIKMGHQTQSWTLSLGKQKAALREIVFAQRAVIITPARACCPGPCIPGGDCRVAPAKVLAAERQRTGLRSGRRAGAEGPRAAAPAPAAFPLCAASGAGLRAPGSRGEEAAAGASLLTGHSCFRSRRSGRRSFLALSTAEIPGPVAHVPRERASRPPPGRARPRSRRRSPCPVAPRSPAVGPRAAPARRPLARDARTQEYQKPHMPHILMTVEMKWP
ncbi:uncharacterized protein LOC125754412 [Canis lupus dingo]|uniref:uncharacterized protein LOC125754412 n=1 Tax=Canis lupus dingo TaxID=286419 RepID=UPI0020C4EFF4|nr:uncharacterized protein LOC125754412 [Canis lupus dingo]